MNNLLLITDVARLRTIFGRLTDDMNIRLRIVNDLEKGGEEIAKEKPDVVFVQTHLSGLSADILLMHLKKQLGRKRARFVLLAAPGQTNDAILKLYHGWLNTSEDDDQLLSELEQLLEILLSKPKMGEDAYSDDPQQPASPSESSAFLSPDASLEDQGLTYAPRQRLKITSEFSNSFDTAVGSTPEPASLAQATPPVSQDWIDDSIETAETKPTRSKKGMFLLWLIPVVIIVVAITYFQQNSPSKPAPAVVKAAPVAGEKPAATIPPAAAVVPPGSGAPGPTKEPAAKGAPLTVISEQDRIADKAILDALAGKKDPPPPPPVVISIAPELTALPRFIPAYGLDKNYSAAHPGWDLYVGNVTEFKVLREAQKIKAIQVIDRGWRGLTDPFLKRAFGQLVKNPSFSVYTSEKKEGYKIQRGRMADNVKAVYYREEKSGLLRAFALTWQ
ncbi:MAG: hypothetical protein ACOYL3_06120 [Desulfuromonadaceae bacterium]